MSQNRLSQSNSPYLLQHADNPVHWYPWGKEAFEAAKKEDKPIFLSIGYATCHWCHVMAHESFEDQAVAELMNRSFINIKVDREERPDIDNTYMHICQMLTGRGGWPLTIVMTPDQEPFYAATYIPKSGRQGHPGMMELVPRLTHLWEEKRDKIHDSAEEITQAFRQSIVPQNSKALDENTLSVTFTKLKHQFDSVHGGFGSAPKFPTPHTLLFLLRYAHTYEEKEAQEMVEQTLTQMRRGGIFDHVGGSFHRYSTDTKWLLPHFEKMLYDQAMHLITYCEGFQASGSELFKQTAAEIADYVLRDLQDDEGGFYSAEDADSEGEEGTFYVWGIEEIREILPAADAELAIEVFNMEPDGNYADESSGQRTGKNILHQTKSLEGLAEERNMGAADLQRKLRGIKQKLFKKREERERPFLDDKILTDWNGLMIAALAKAGRTLKNTEYIEEAERAASFLFDNMITEEGELLHRYRNDEASIPATADDYAFLIWGLLELYESTFNTHYLQKAIALNETFFELYWDDENGGFYFTAESSEELLGRKKEFMDNAMPSANSVAAMNLLRIGRITADTEWENRTTRIIEATSETIEKAPTSFTQLLQAHLWAENPSYEIVIAGKKSESGTGAFLNQLNQLYVPHKVVLLHEPSDAAIESMAPYTENQSMRDGQPAAYVCRDHSCKEPAATPEHMKEQLRS